jgi:stalled ribosome rescue protein Dom34
VKVLKQRKRYRRGYPNAILAGMEETYSVLWKIFSRVVKPEKTIGLEGSRSNSKDLFNFHESIVNALRPTLKEGVRSVILVSPAKTTFAAEFSKHVRQHHKWLVQGPNKAVFSQMTGLASNLSQVAKLTNSSIFRQIINLTAAEETESLIEVLEKRLNSSEEKSRVLFSLEEVETMVLRKHKPGRFKPEYLLLTDKYLSDSREKNRLLRLMQIAANRKVKTRVVKAESSAGVRLLQLGGIVCIAQLE